MSAALIEAYLAGIQTVRAAVAGMSREQVRARPVAGKWSTLEVVCHLADFEPIYADRMKRILAEERPLLMSGDEQAFAKALAYDNRELEEELNIIENTRRQLARILRTVPESAFRRVGIFRDGAQIEERPLERFLTSVTNHIPHHVKFIMDKRRALGLAG